MGLRAGTLLENRGPVLGEQIGGLPVGHSRSRVTRPSSGCPESAGRLLVAFGSVRGWEDVEKNDGRGKY